MSTDSTDETVDDLEDVTEILEEMQEKLGQIESRVDSLEDTTETKVRVVDTDNGKRIVLENQQQTWFSPNYFRKILERIDEGEDDSEDETILD